MENSKKHTKLFWKSGEPFVWTTSMAMALIIIFTFMLIAVIFINGMGVFWASPVYHYYLKDGNQIQGELVKREADPAENGQHRIQIKMGNRDLYGIDFKWIKEGQITKTDYPKDIYVVERNEYGNLYGYLSKVIIPKDQSLSQGSMDDHLIEWHKNTKAKGHELEKIDKKLSNTNISAEHLRIKMLKYKGKEVPEKLLKKEKALQAQFDQLVSLQNDKRKELQAYRAIFKDANGKEKELTLHSIIRFYKPNQISTFKKVTLYLEKIVELLIDSPRESNTEGGLFPAIFGTVTLIFLMSILSFPMGVVAAVYLREYAHDGMLVRLVRIAVNNLAGVPSIVYGIFGLVFFVYGIGNTIDALFFAERLPNPTWGTGGILWASLTLGILTIPVVIVSTEEALGSIPMSVREASLSLGATKFQTLMKILLPMASPGILTGFILSMARAAGEVAPLMITGVVKMAPSLPVEGTFPYFHFERKFMHLGFHIYDVGFQSPNVEAAKPFVFVTTLLLVFIVLVMSSLAIHLRNQMKKKYTYKPF